jgi:hypothetical protein
VLAGNHVGLTARRTVTLCDLTLTCCQPFMHQRAGNTSDILCTCAKLARVHTAAVTGPVMDYPIAERYLYMSALQA